VDGNRTHPLDLPTLFPYIASESKPDLSHTEIAPISTQTPSRGISPLLQILSVVCFLTSVILFIAAILPTSIWRDTVIGSTSWGVEDDEDLKYMRVVFAGFGLIFLLWSAVFA